jgi:hypothetical protein
MSLEINLTGFEVVPEVYNFLKPVRFFILFQANIRFVVTASAVKATKVAPTNL